MDMKTKRMVLKMKQRRKRERKKGDFEEKYGVDQV